MTKDPQRIDSEKTRWCEKCHRRHRNDHEHFQGADGEAIAASDPTATVIGAENAEGLASKVKNMLGVNNAKKERKARKEKEPQVSAEELERRRKRSVMLGRKFASAPFTIAAITTGNPEWRKQLAQEDIEGIAQDWASFAEAWGIGAVGKVASVIALAISYSEVTGRVYVKVKAGEVIA